MPRKSLNQKLIEMEKTGKPLILTMEEFKRSNLTIDTADPEDDPNYASEEEYLAAMEADMEAYYADKE